MWHVGTSGWQYRDWRGRLYPQGLAQARWLEHYADRFATVGVTGDEAAAMTHLNAAALFDHPLPPEDWLCSTS